MPSYVVRWLFFTTIFLWHEVAARLKVPSRRCFLDKSCIHQTDMKRMAEGIQSLAAFLGSSRRMLVVYTSTYLERLWTVYELATVLILNPEMTVEIVPILMPKMVFLGNLTWTICNGLALALPKFVSAEALYALTASLAVIAWFLLAICARSLAHMADDVHRRLENFSIASAKCAVESDRQIVQRNVEAFMRSTGHVEISATSEETLLAFDVLVKTTLPAHLTCTFGHMCLPYRYVMLITMCVGLHVFDLVSSLIRAGCHWRVIASTTLFWCTRFFAVDPLLASLLWLLSTRFLYLRRHGCKERLWMLVSSLLTSGTCLTVWISLLWGSLTAMESDTNLIIYACCCGVCALSAFMVFYMVPHIRRLHLLREQEEALNREEALEHSPPTNMGEGCPNWSSEENTELADTRTANAGEASYFETNEASDRIDVQPKEMAAVQGLFVSAQGADIFEDDFLVKPAITQRFSSSLLTSSLRAPLEGDKAVFSIGCCSADIGGHDGAVPSDSIAIMLQGDDDKAFKPAPTPNSFCF